jgi:L-alanine-DL-glutamate epimerase-like enolase superfamily enzyme
LKITEIETIWIDELPTEEWRRQHPDKPQVNSRNLWVRVHTNEGLIGLGETYYQPRAVSAIVHDCFSHVLLGRSALDIESHWNNMFSIVNFFGYAGAEIRAISAIDIALWDLLGQYLGQPIYNVLGGRTRHRIPVYNTCVNGGKHMDYTAFMDPTKIGDLARSLLDQGIRRMKIWPFDQYGFSVAIPEKYGDDIETLGIPGAVGPPAPFIDHRDLKAGIAYIEAIRKAVGDEMAIAIEGHSRWGLTAAIQIAQALEKFDNIMWIEDFTQPDNVESLARLKASSRVPLAASERLYSRYQFRQLMENNAADIVMPDIGWCGGITEFRKIASAADTYYLPVTSHDCTGPVVLWASGHVMLHAQNAMLMEAVRGFWDGGWYNDVMTEPVPIEDGHFTLGTTPGLGATLREDLLSNPQVRRESSK